MNDYWHIPRASLASSSAASTASSSNRSNKSNSQTPTVAQRTLQQQHHQRQHAKNTGKERELVGSSRHHTRAGHAKRISNTRRDSELSATSAATTAAAAAAVLAAAAASSAQTTAAVATKRGSRSSQGSSGSNNSTRSAASGSMLLTAANLERFAEIHKKQQQHNKLYMENVPTVHNGNAAYTANLALALQHQHQQQQHRNSNNNNNTNNNNDAIITMDPNLDFIKTKDLDTVSIASSMHFTMVNGEGGPPKKPKRGLCDRGRQVTVLIISMSMIFMLLIMGMVYALEMRAREMPQS